MSLADTLGNFASGIGSLFVKDGQPQWNNILPLVGGIAGMYSANNDKNAKPQGYQGGIPQYTAIREQVPVNDAGRRPGSGGRRYFSDTLYAAPGQEAEYRQIAKNQASGMANSADVSRALTSKAPPVTYRQPAPSQQPTLSTSGIAALLADLAAKNNASSGAKAQPGYDTQGVMTERGITGVPTGTVLAEGPWAGGTALSKDETPIEAFLRANEGKTPESAIYSFLKFKGVTPEEFKKQTGKDWPEGYACGGHVEKYANGGLAAMGSPSYYLGGAADGMGDTLDAKLSGGEFVFSADDVADIGNGNSEAGAKELYQMRDRIRRARRGTPVKGKRINPRQMMPV